MSSKITLDTKEDYFGYNDLTIAAQRDIAPVIRGNTGGRYEKVKWHNVSNEPVHKRKKEVNYIL